jgi:hypothetical protein
MTGLLVERDRLLLAADLHAQPLGARRDRQVAIAQPTDQVERFQWWLLLREPHRVRLHAPLHCRPDLRRAPEEAVGRDESFERLVRPLEVVAIDEERDPPRAVREVREDRPRQELVPERLPEAFDLPECLRVLRPALHVPDALPPQLPLELRRSAPRRVLPALVRQDLPRRPVRRDPAVERLHHQRGPLVMRDRMRHDEARVVVHERGQVEPLMSPEQEREDVRLPQLVRCRPLEPAFRVLARSSGLLSLDEALLVEDPPHLVLRHAQRLEPLQQIRDPSRAVLRVLLPQLLHRLVLGIAPPRPRHRGHDGLRHQRVETAPLVPPDPLVDRGRRQPEDPRHVSRRGPLVHDLPDHP